MTYQEIGADPRALEGKKFEVEELGLGFAKYENGLTLDILESWAIHMDNIGDSFVVGTKGGLRLPYQLEYQDQVLKYMNLVNGQTTEAEIRFDTAWLALQTMLVSEGIFLSGKLGREVTVDEIEAMSESNAIRVQKTPYGSFQYDF